MEKEKVNSVSAVTPPIASNAVFGEEARARVKAGIDLVADSVKHTLGAAGTNGIIPEFFTPFHVITNDGISIANKVKCEDPHAQFGVQLLQEVAQRSDKVSGDGTTTTMVLTQAILNEAEKYIAENGVPAIHVKRQLDEAAEEFKRLIKEEARPVSIGENLAKVVTVAAEDEELGEIIDSVYQEIGEEGIVEVVAATGEKTSCSIVDGYRIRSGAISPLFLGKNGKSELTEIPVLVTMQKISTFNDLDATMQLLQNSKINKLFILCNEIEETVLGALVLAKRQGLFDVTVVQVPTIWKEYIMEDFAKLAGATPISVDTGSKLSDVTEKHIGFVGKITVTKTETVATGFNTDISEHIEMLKQDGSDDALRRVNWLKTKTAFLRIGAPTETDLSYRRLKAEDAKNTAYLAIKGGYTVGGGVTLYKISNILEGIPSAGEYILSRALKVPMKQIMLNAGVDVEGEIKGVEEGMGFNSKTLKMSNLEEDGVLDAALVVENAVINAISIAGTALTINVSVAPIKEDSKEI